MNSKLLLCGIIASTFLTVSCQKKGARPPLAAAAVQTEKNAPTEQAPKTPEADQLQLPPVTTPQKVETKEKSNETTADKKEDSSTPKTEHKDEVKKEDDQAKKEDSSKEEKKDPKETVVVKTEETKKDSTTTKEKVKENINQEKTPVKKDVKNEKEETQNKTSACTDNLIQKIDDLRSTETDLKKEKDKKKSIDLMKSYIKSCGDFFRSINNHNDKSCVIQLKEKKATVTESLFTERCNFVGYLLEQAGVKNVYAKKHQTSVKAEIEKLKTNNYILTEDAHALLKKENNDFKMFILDSEIKTDEALTKDSKSIACSFTSTDISIIPGNLVVAKVTSIESADINTEKRSLLKLTLTSQDKDIVEGMPADHKLSLTASLICKNLNVEHFNLTKFEKSLEKLFTKK